MGNVKTVTDGARLTIVYTYDKVGRCTAVRYKIHGEQTYTYDSVSRMTELVLPEGSVWHYACDGLEKIIKETDPSIGSAVMEIAQRVIKEQEEQRKEWERVLESRYELQHMEDSGTEGVPSKGKTEIFGAENVTTKEKIEELAQLYGSKKYEEREELIASPLINLTARVIYGEQTEAGEAQDIVAWTMINRVLSQKKEHTGGREVTLYNVLTTPKQYTVLDKEQNNTLSFDGKEPGTSGWDGWQHAFELAYQIDEILGDVGENTTQEELDAARRKLEEAIGESPIGTGRFFRAEKDFYAKLSESIEGNELISYYENTRIKSDYVRKNGNVFFEYY